MECVRFPARQSSPRRPPGLSSHLQTGGAHLTAPDGTREGNLARTNARPAALQFRVKQVPGHVSKEWELVQSEALAVVAPTQRPSPPRHPPAPLPSSPFLPSGSSSVLSCPCPSSDLFAGLTPFFPRPPKTAASLSPL